MSKTDVQDRLTQLSSFESELEEILFLDDERKRNRRGVELHSQFFKYEKETKEYWSQGEKERVKNFLDRMLTDLFKLDLAPKMVEVDEKLLAAAFNAVGDCKLAETTAGQYSHLWDLVNAVEKIAQATDNDS